MDLFDNLKECNKQVPLAEILRPKTLDEYLGQTNVMSENSALFGLLNSGRLFSVLFWGPPGCGKTTLINLLMRFYDIDSGKLLLQDYWLTKLMLILSNFLPLHQG